MYRFLIQFLSTVAASSSLIIYIRASEASKELNTILFITVLASSLVLLVTLVEQVNRTINTRLPRQPTDPNIPDWSSLNQGKHPWDI